MPGQAPDFLTRPAPAGGVTPGLPEDLQARAVRRIGIFAWIVLAVDIAGTAIDHTVAAFTSPAWPDRFQTVDLVGSAVIAAACLGMGLAARAPIAVSRRMAVGTAFLFFLAAAIAIVDFGDAFWTWDGGIDHALHGPPALIAVMLVTPVILPMTAWRAALLGLAMAATGPLAMLLDAWLLGVERPGPQPLAQSFPFLVVPVVAGLAHIVHGLGLDVKRARALGAYTLEEKLGEGGMGEVWRARHRFLARPAAVKLIRGATEDEGRRARFEREAQATAALRSPHTVEVYDFGVSNANEIYYVMELLDGIDLEQLVDRYGPQPPARVVSWLRQACHSLREAHAAGIIHRDIKPANLYACRYGADYDVVKVLDFGIASLGPAIDADETRLTMEGKVVGTPAFMAPELVKGSAVADARSDLYALGCVAYHALTGRRVFEGATPLEMIVGHVERAPAPPSQVASQPIPEALERLVLACLAKSPDDRPQSADDMLLRLRDQPAWSEREAERWWTETYSPRSERMGSTRDARRAGT